MVNINIIDLIIIALLVVVIYSLKRILTLEKKIKEMEQIILGMESRILKNVKKK